MYRVGQNHTFIRIYSVHTVFLAGKSPNIRSYTVWIYGPGQPYVCNPLQNVRRVCWHILWEVAFTWTVKGSTCVEIHTLAHTCTQAGTCCGRWLSLKPWRAAQAFEIHTLTHTCTQAGTCFGRWRWAALSRAPQVFGGHLKSSCCWTLWLPLSRYSRDVPILDLPKRLYRYCVQYYVKNFGGQLKFKLLRDAVTSALQVFQRCPWSKLSQTVVKNLCLNYREKLSGASEIALLRDADLRFQGISGDVPHTLVYDQFKILVEAGWSGRGNC